MAEILRGKRDNRLGLLAVGVILAALFMVAPHSEAAAKKADLMTFASPEEAVKVMVDAAKAGDEAVLLRIFGQEGKALASSGSPAEDKAARERFMEAYAKKSSFRKKSDTETVLVVGEEEWPFPVPIVKKGDRWVFDARTGIREIVHRRIGRNELMVIDFLKSYVEAQRYYAGKDRDGDQVLEYAQTLVSTPGQKDGLWWEAQPGGEQCPLPAAAAVAEVERGSKAKAHPAAIPYYGYYFKILKGQGEKAKSGAHDYVVKGNMVLGFALAAYPARFGVTGVKTFQVSHDGIVYEKNLGRNTEKAVKSMTLFDPAKGWTKVE